MQVGKQASKQASTKKAFSRSHALEGLVVIWLEAARDWLLAVSVLQIMISQAAEEYPDLIKRKIRSAASHLRSEKIRRRCTLILAQNWVIKILNEQVMLL